MAGDDPTGPPDNGMGGVSMTRKAPKSPDEMTEAELAEYYYSHRDELAGEEVTSRTPARMDVMVSARFSKTEAAKVRAAAARANMSLSAFLRRRVLASLEDNVIDLDRARADLREMRSKATDALRALADDPTPLNP
jgi:hypothetical protein